MPVYEVTWPEIEAPILPPKDKKAESELAIRKFEEWQREANRVRPFIESEPMMPKQIGGDK